MIKVGFFPYHLNRLHWCFSAELPMQCGEGLGSSILFSYGATRKRDAACPSSGHGAASSIPQQQHDGLCGPCGACGRLVLLCSLPWELLELDASSLFHGGLLDRISCARNWGLERCCWVRQKRELPGSLGRTWGIQIV